MTGSTEQEIIASEDASPVENRPPTSRHQQKQKFADAKVELDQQKLKDTVDRYQFLLGQSDLFSHFIRSKNILPEAELEAAKMYSTPVVTQIETAPTIYPAEDYHQNYFQQHPNQGYCMVVVAPKLAKFRAKFKSLIAPQYL